MTMSRSESLVTKFAVVASAIVVAAATQLVTTIAVGAADLNGDSYVVADGHGWIGAPRP
jgi:hypothetical protein